MLEPRGAPKWKFRDLRHGDGSRGNGVYLKKCTHECANERLKSVRRISCAHLGSQDLGEALAQRCLPAIDRLRSGGKTLERFGRRQTCERTRLAAGFLLA
jgi:hypothetical protein